MKNAEVRKKAIKRQAAVINILIAHDHEIVRIGLRALLKGKRGFRICGETSTAATTLKAVEKVKPDILLLKLSLPDQGALDIITRLLEIRPGLKVLVFSAEGPTKDAQLAVLTPTVAKRVLEEGALGLVLKPDAQDIRLAIDALRQNKSYVSSNIFEGVATELLHRTERLQTISDLTIREAEVFKRLATGMTTKEMAVDLRISPRTIEVYRASIMRKLNLKSQADLILLAIKNRVVELPWAVNDRGA